jgi:hypothetical protein
MEVCIRSRDIMLSIFHFLSLDDWNHVRMLNRNTQKDMVTRLGPFIHNMVSERFYLLLAQRLGERELVEGFLNALFQSGGVVAGSIFLELLLGSTEFKAADIDIFFPKPNCQAGWSVLQKWLYYFAQDTSMVEATFPLALRNLTMLQRNQFYNSNYDIRVDLTPGSLIAQVHNYTMNGVFQVIEVRQDSPKDIVRDFIEPRFDFECCKGTFRILVVDEQKKVELRLPPIGQVCRRELVVSPKRQKMMAFECKETYMKARVEKYQARKFHLLEPLSSLGTHFHYVSQLPLRRGHYPFEKLMALCNSVSMRTRSKKNEKQCSNKSDVSHSC